MTLNAADVRTVEFPLTRRGYDERQVDDFLDRVVAALEERDAALIEAADAVRSASAASGNGHPAQHTDDEPRSAVELLEMAHRTAQDHMAAAEVAADQLLGRAQQEAQDAVEAAQSEAHRLRAAAEVQQREVLQGLEGERRSLEQRLVELRELLEQSRNELERYLIGVHDAVRGLSPVATGPHAVPARSA